MRDGGVGRGDGEHFSCHVEGHEVRDFLAEIFGGDGVVGARAFDPGGVATGGGGDPVFGGELLGAGGDVLAGQGRGGSRASTTQRGGCGTGGSGVVTASISRVMWRVMR